MRFGVSVHLTLESHALVVHAPEELLGVILVGVVPVVPWGNVVHLVVFVLHEFPHEFHHRDGVHDLVIWHVVGLHVLPVLLSLEVLSVHHVVVHVVPALLVVVRLVLLLEPVLELPVLHLVLHHVVAVVHHVALHAIGLHHVVSHVTGHALDSLHKVLLVLLSAGHDGVDESEWGPVEGKFKFRGISSVALGNSFLELDSVGLHVILSPAALHGLHAGPLLEHPVFILPPPDGRRQQENCNNLHPSGFCRLGFGEVPMREI